MPPISPDTSFPIHVLVRFSDFQLPSGTTIKLHQEVISEQGAVWFGKAGKPLASSHVEHINRQCAKQPSYLYLVQRVAGEYSLYRGSVLSMARSLPPDERVYVPRYYKDLYLLRDIRYWTKLSKLTKAPNRELEKLVLVNTGMPARLSLLNSMAGLFLVRRFRSL